MGNTRLLCGYHCRIVLHAVGHHPRSVLRCFYRRAVGRQGNEAGTEIRLRRFSRFPAWNGDEVRGLRVLYLEVCRGSGIKVFRQSAIIQTGIPKGTNSFAERVSASSGYMKSSFSMKSEMLNSLPDSFIIRLTILQRLCTLK